MIKPAFVIVAETVLHDRSSNTMSAINIIEQFRPPGYPIIIPRVTLLSMLERDAADDSNAVVTIQVRLDNDTIADQNIDADFRAENVTRVILQYGGFIVPRPGTIRFVVSIGAQSMQSHPIIAFIPPQQEALQLEPPAAQAPA